MLMYLTRCWKLHKNHITESSNTMKKLSKITESVWSDMQDRGTGDMVKKEDTIGNSNVLKPVDLGGSVYWADKDLVVDDQELFTFYDTIEVIKNVRGWRLPTRKEASELYGHNMYYDPTYVYLDDDRKISFKKAGVGYLNQNHMPYTLDKGRSFYGWTSEQFQADSMHIFIIDNDEINISPDNATPFTVMKQSKDSRCSIRLVRSK